MRLLAKNPAERSESATDVSSALDALDLIETPFGKGGWGISDPHALDSLAGGVFVGRKKEMGDLKASLEDALSGRGRLVTLVGEPGIGKSRTAQELTTYAGLRGAQVLWGRSYEEQGVPPYWPWVQTIRSYVQSHHAEELGSEMGHGAATIAEIIPDLRDKLTDLETPPALDPEQARFRLFDSITSFLRNASRNQPLMLVLDDLHWADRSSLLLLQFLARELAPAQSGHLLVVGCYRDAELSRQHPLSETLAQLSRSAGGGFQRVLPRGLDQEATTELIEAGAGIVPTTGLVEALYSRTEGNPFFMTEVIRLLSESGELTAGHVGTPAGLRIPEGVRGGDWTTSQPAIGAVQSGIGRRIFDWQRIRFQAPLHTLSVEETEDRVLEALEEAITAGIIEEPAGTTARYQFTNALIQEIL
ncbi:MAG: AAA family ATPase, partial [Chloroflexota bacterium]|nr:AAA family ATPase [Chloroflexota bacterium]